MSALDAVAGMRPGTASREWSGYIGEFRRSAIASLFGAGVRDGDAVSSQQDEPPGAHSSHVGPARQEGDSD